VRRELSKTSRDHILRELTRQLVTNLQILRVDHAGQATTETFRDGGVHFVFLV